MWILNGLRDTPWANELWFKNKLWSKTKRCCSWNIHLRTCGTWVVAFRVRWHLPVEFRENSTRFRGPDGLKIALFWPYAITVLLTDRSVFSARSFVPVCLLLMGDHEICINCPIHGIIIEWIYSTTTRLTLAIKPPPIEQTHHECDYPIDDDEGSMHLSSPCPSASALSAHLIIY